jgi:hypothetical protein
MASLYIYIYTHFLAHEGHVSDDVFAEVPRREDTLV